MLSSSDPLGMSTAQRKFVSITTAWGGVVALLSSAAEAHTAKATSDMRRQRRTMMGHRHQAVARDRARMATMSSRRSSRRKTTITMTTRIGQCGGCHSGNSSL